MNMKLEVVLIPVSDVDRAKAFYEKVGFRLDIDIANENFRGIQFTPPRSEASIIFGEGVTSANSSPAELVKTLTAANTVSPTLREPTPHEQINGSAARIAGGKPELLDLPELPVP